MGVRGQLHTLLALTPEKKLGTQCIGGWVGSRASLDVVAKRKILSPCLELNLSRPAHC